MKKYKSYQTLQEILSARAERDYQVEKIISKQEFYRKEIKRLEEGKSEVLLRANAKTTRLSSNLTLTLSELVRAYCKTFGVKSKDVTVLCETDSTFKFKPDNKDIFLGDDLYLLIRSTENQTDVNLTFPLAENTLNGRNYRNGFELIKYANQSWGLRLNPKYYGDLRVRNISLDAINDMPVEFINNLIRGSISHENKKKNSPSVD